MSSCGSETETRVHPAAARPSGAAGDARTQRGSSQAWDGAGPGAQLARPAWGSGTRHLPGCTSVGRAGASGSARTILRSSRLRGRPSRVTPLRVTGPKGERDGGAGQAEQSA